jgi:hypothetical protein
MKKLLFTTIAVFILFSCSIDDDTQGVENLVFYSYYHTINYPYLESYPVSGPKVSARCYFFKAEDIKTPILKENIIIEKSYPDYATVQSEVVELLFKENKLKLSDNSIINSIEIETRNSALNTSLSYYANTSVDDALDYNFNKFSYNEISLKPGKYYVVVITPDYGYNFYSDKYSGKFISVSSEMSNNDRYIKIVFPWDFHRKGYFDWIDATDE